MRAAGARSACSAPSPVERGLKPVVAPEQFAVGGHEARCTENAERLRFLALRAKRSLHRVRLRLRDNRVGIATQLSQYVLYDAVLTNVPTFPEFAAIHRVGPIFAPALLESDQRDAGRQQRILREQFRPHER